MKHKIIAYKNPLIGMCASEVRHYVNGYIRDGVNDNERIGVMDGGLPIVVVTLGAAKAWLKGIVK